MAKKKSESKPEPQRLRDAVIHVRASAAWKDSIERLADFDRAPSVADLIDRAIVSYARSINFSEPIPKR